MKRSAVEALATLRARLRKAGATKVLVALDRAHRAGRIDDVDAVGFLFTHPSLGRGIEDDVAAALARIGDDVADWLVTGLGSKRPVLRRAAARALCIAPSRSRKVRAALQATLARDDELRTTRGLALALSSKRPATALGEELDRATTVEVRELIVRVAAAGANANAELRRALLKRADDPRWADVRVALLAAVKGART